MVCGGGGVSCILKKGVKADLPVGGLRHEMRRTPLVEQPTLTPSKMWIKSLRAEPPEPE